MPLAREIWLQDFQENLFEGLEFIGYSTSHDGFALNSKIIHVPQTGSKPAVSVNRATVPATITQRTDSDLTYAMDEFTTDPILVRDVETIQLAGDKRASVLQQHKDVIKESMASTVLRNWSISGSKTVRTSGANSDVLAPSATGTRKAITLQDISKLAGIFDKDNVSKSDRYLAMPSDLYYQLFGIDALIRQDYMGAVALPAGVIRQLFGFNILVNNFVATYDGSAAIKGVAAAAAATDNLAAIAWSKSAVAKAQGDIKLFADEDKPEYYGSIFSAMCMLGSTKLRSDNKGLAALVQAA